ncbi:Stress response protein NST1 domain-containing protein [Rozella allomycis CSF55]|uniref:Stress response protein NST1 n=1 Tax=Rozella allomycis (strain CSF55) TaxID=988480 RepID=A0A075ARA2_ROZAC|nr:Stress response protein NST1 domain-containing protein [Rozella allomycis CSF55]|eukprot:EPZ32768.1 Stress response protein NST1 domain-containing protein [Rozella allomycis CSF55]
MTRNVVDETLPSLIDDDSDSEFYSEEDEELFGSFGTYEEQCVQVSQKSKKNKKKNGSNLVNEEVEEQDEAEDERTKIREFWLSLSQNERKSLVDMEKEAVLKRLLEHKTEKCDCSSCGRQKVMIEEEIEMLYDAYYEELEMYTKVVKDQRLPLPLSMALGIRDSSKMFMGKAVNNAIMSIAEDLTNNRGSKMLKMLEGFAQRRMKMQSRHSREMQPHHCEEEKSESEYDSEDYESDQYAEEGLSDDEEFDNAEEERSLEEGRKMFQVFAAKMFEQRVLNAYRERVAQEKQRQLLEEVEREELLNQQRELNKQKQKLKKKERKNRQIKQQKMEEKLAKEKEKKEQEEKARLEKQRQKEEARLRQLEKEEKERKAREEEMAKRLEQLALEQAQTEEKKKKKKKKKKDAGEKTDSPLEPTVLKVIENEPNDVPLETKPKSEKPISLSGKIANVSIKASMEEKENCEKSNISVAQSVTEFFGAHSENDPSLDKQSGASSFASPRQSPVPAPPGFFPSHFANDFKKVPSQPPRSNPVPMMIPPPFPIPGTFQYPPMMHLPHSQFHSSHVPFDPIVPPSLKERTNSPDFLSDSTKPLDFLDVSSSFLPHDLFSADDSFFSKSKKAEVAPIQRPRRENVDNEGSSVWSSKLTFL